MQEDFGRRCCGLDPVSSARSSSRHCLPCRCDMQLYVAQQLLQAFSEFSTLWLEEFSQPYLPAAAVQILCALATTAMRVPPKTPKDGVFRKWRQEVETLLEYCTDPQQTFHVSPDDILEVAQRLGKLGETEAVRLVPWQLCQNLLLCRASCRLWLLLITSRALRLLLHVLHAAAVGSVRKVEGIQTTLHTYKQKELRRATVASAASAGSGKVPGLGKQLCGRGFRLYTACATLLRLIHADPKQRVSVPGADTNRRGTAVALVVSHTSDIMVRMHLSMVVRMIAAARTCVK